MSDTKEESREPLLDSKEDFHFLKQKTRQNEKYGWFSRNTKAGS
jgi:hypothetical protein